MGSSGVRRYLPLDGLRYLGVDQDLSGDVDYRCYFDHAGSPQHRQRRRNAVRQRASHSVSRRTSNTPTRLRRTTRLVELANDAAHGRALLQAMVQISDPTFQRVGMGMVWSNLNGVPSRGQPARTVRVTTHIGSEPIGAVGRFHEGSRRFG